jgi:hypothetical protein
MRTQFLIGLIRPIAIDEIRNVKDFCGVSIVSEIVIGLNQLHLFTETMT